MVLQQLIMRKNNIHELVKLLNPKFWNIEEVVILWRTAEDKIYAVNIQFYRQININVFCELVKVFLHICSNQYVTYSILNARSSERVLTKNVIYSDEKNSLDVDNMANLMIINLISIPLYLRNLTVSVKKCLKKVHSADDKRGKKITIQFKPIGYAEVFREYFQTKLKVNVVVLLRK